MLDCASPRSSNAAPEISVTSRNVPSPLLRNRKFGFMSLATYRSIRPSPFKIGGDDSEAVTVGAADSRAVGYIGEGAVAIVAVQDSA